MWTQLGEILQTIKDRNDFMHIATVLLPLIESFMVVSKPYVVRKKQTIAFSHKSLLSMSRQNSTMELGSYDLFVHFTDQHRKILNTMVRNNPSLMGGSFSLLVDNPKILEFDNKKTYFTQQLHKKANTDSHRSIQVNVRRQYVFEDSYHQLQGRSGDEIKNSKLNVRFYEEEGVDAGGVTREWYTVLARQMFNPDYALFKPSAADKVTYQPNRSSGINPDHLSYFKFVGRIIGKAIYDGRLLDCYFTRSFYKLMLGIDVDYKDIEPIDPSYHKSLEWILNNEINDVLDLNFVLEVDEFGRQRTVELIPNGKNTPVTDENKHEYVHLIAQQRLVVAIKDQINAFLTGFQEIIPKDLIKIFNEQELELLISGLPDIDIDDW
jgi:E3 ubiquitin-protein ligase HUWE1